MRLLCALIAVVLLAACSENVGRGTADARVDLRADLRRDTRAPLPDRARDTAPPRPGDLAGLIDYATGDAKPSPATVLYTTTADPASFGLRTVTTGMAGKPTAVPGWNGYLDLVPLSIAGLQEHVPVSPGRPQVTAEHPAGLQGIRLPGKLGLLYHVRKKLAGTSALLLIREGGVLEVVREVTGLYADAIGSHVALRAGGELGAAVAGPTGAFLFRTDQKPFPGGTATWKEIAPASGTVTQIRPASLTLAGDFLYAVGMDSGGKDLLLRAPVDGSAALSPVSLPSSAGQPPISIADGMVVSADGKVLIVVAGASGAQRDLYRVEVQSGAATNLTKAPSAIAERGDTFGQLAGLLAVSPAGGRVGFVRMEQGKHEVYVARTDGAAPVQVTGDVTFEPDVVQIANLLFAGEDNLLFMAGVTLTQLEVFRFDAAAAKAHAVTGGQLEPFNGVGNISPQTAWVSPSGKWLYLLATRLLYGTTDLLGVDLAAFTSLKLTTNAAVQAAPGSIAACPSSSQVFFAARPNPKLYPNEIWSFEQDAAKPAVQRTAASGPGQWMIWSLLLSPDCSRLIWSGGGAHNLRELWLLPASGPVRKLTPSPSFIGSSLQLTADQATLVYSSGGGSGSATLKAVPLAPGPPVTLDSAAGTVHVFSVY